MKNCTFRLSLDELLNRPASEMRLVGADEDPEENDPEDEDLEDDDDKEDDKDKKPKAKEPKLDAKDRLILRLKDDKVTLREQRDTARTERDEARAETIKVRAESVTDEDTAKRLTGLETDKAKLTEQVRQLQISLAFAESVTHKWKDPEAARKLAELGDVEIDAKGKVSGLEDALDALAEAKPWLLETEAEDDQEDDDAEPKPKKTGTKVQTQRKKPVDPKSAQVRKSTLQNKYPGLRR